MVSDAAVADHLVPEDDEPQVIDILHVVLLHIHAVLHEEPRGEFMFQMFDGCIIVTVDRQKDGEAAEINRIPRNIFNTYTDFKLTTSDPALIFILSSGTNGI